MMSDNASVYTSSLYGSGSGNIPLVPIALVNGQEAHWQFRMKTALRSSGLWTIVSGVETTPVLAALPLRSSSSTDATPARVALNLADVGSTELSDGPNLRSTSRLMDESHAWRIRHDKAFNFIQSSLALNDFGMSKAIEMEVYEADVALAWKHITKSFDVVNNVWGCILLKLQHYRNFQRRPDEQLEQYCGRVQNALISYRNANEGLDLDNIDQIVFLLIGLGDIFDEVKGDLGRLSKEETTYKRVLDLIRQNRTLDRISSQFSSKNVMQEEAGVFLHHSSEGNNNSGLQKARKKYLSKRRNEKKKSDY
jgi:hypothetical protein